VNEWKLGAVRLGVGFEDVKQENCGVHAVGDWSAALKNRVAHSLWALLLRSALAIRNWANDT
jgi:hypothetical protein